MTLNQFLMSTAVAALLAGAATAQDTTGNSDTGVPTDDAAPSVGTTTDPGAAAPAVEYTSLEQMTVGDMLGMSVVSTGGELIGDIDYVIQDANGASAVIGIGGFLGLGEYTVALPLSDFQYDAEQRVLMLDSDKETLESQPEFDESDVESLPDETRIADLMGSDVAPGSAGASDSSATVEEGATETESMSDEGSTEGAASDESSMSEEGSAGSGAAVEGGTDEEILQEEESDG